MMLPSLRGPMVTLLLLVACIASGESAARTMQVHAQRVVTTVATIQDVRLRLDWPSGSTQGDLELTAARLDAPDLGYRFQDLAWHCVLRRDGQGAWHCDGELRAGRNAPVRFAVDLEQARTQASLSRGDGRLTVTRIAATPDETSIDFTRVPMIWSQALLARAWQDGLLKSGTLDGYLRVSAPRAQPLRVAGTLTTTNAAFESHDATIAGDRLGSRFAIDYRKAAHATTVTVDGALQRGEILVGNAYVALPATPVGLHVDAVTSDAGGWRLPVIAWHDGKTLVAQGSAAFDGDANLRSLDMQLHSDDLAPLGKGYLSGWLAVAGLEDLQLRGGANAQVLVTNGRLQAADATLDNVDVADAKGRFRFDGLDGTPRFSAVAPVAGTLRWRSGQLYGLDFAAATLPIDSNNGELRLRQAVRVPMLGGGIRFDRMTLRPPSGDAGADIRFGLTLDHLDVGQLSKSLGWPAFQGQLSGSIPNARYAGERLQFDGGLNMALFGGTVRATSLSMERPFGVAPSLTADLTLDNLDLQALTGVFDFGSITGRLAGHIDALRLVDWTATAFDAELHTVKVAGVPRRISQRAVQNISSVGDASFTSSLQSRLIGLFKDFGYSRIGIRCRLGNEVCDMGGLEASHGSGPEAGSGSEAGGFTIVEGAGIPHLTVVGFHRKVDWPTLVERLAAVSKGEVKPVVQ